MPFGEEIICLPTFNSDLKTDIQYHLLLCYVNTTFQATTKRPFSSSTGKNLCFHYKLFRIYRGKTIVISQHNKLSPLIVNNNIGL